jgi:hypothetical protein
MDTFVPSYPTSSTTRRQFELDKVSQSQRSGSTQQAFTKEPGTMSKLLASDRRRLEREGTTSVGFSTRMANQACLSSSAAVRKNSHKIGRQTPKANIRGAEMSFETVHSDSREARNGGIERETLMTRRNSPNSPLRRPHPYFGASSSVWDFMATEGLSDAGVVGESGHIDLRHQSEDLHRTCVSGFAKLLEVIMQPCCAVHDWCDAYGVDWAPEGGWCQEHEV